MFLGHFSLVEALPLCSPPFAYDQGLNARLVMAKKPKVVLLRKKEARSFVREDKAWSMRLVMVDIEEEECRPREKKLARVLWKRTA